MIKARGFCSPDAQVICHDESKLKVRIKLNAPWDIFFNCQLECNFLFNNCQPLTRETVLYKPFCSGNLYCNIVN